MRNRTRLTFRQATVSVVRHAEYTKSDRFGRLTTELRPSAGDLMLDARNATDKTFAFRYCDVLLFETDHEGERITASSQPCNFQQEVYYIDAAIWQIDEFAREMGTLPTALEQMKMNGYTHAVYCRDQFFRALDPHGEVVRTH